MITHALWIMNFYLCNNTSVNQTCSMRQQHTTNCQFCEVEILLCRTYISALLFRQRQFLVSINFMFNVYLWSFRSSASERRQLLLVIHIVIDDESPLASSASTCHKFPQFIVKFCVQSMSHLCDSLMELTVSKWAGLIYTYGDI